MSEKELALFLRWLLKHYSTKTIDGGMFCYVDSMDKEVSMETIVKHYLDHIGDTNKMPELSDEEIEAQALTFAKEESYGKLNSDLWKGYVFGAKKMREQLKSKQ